MKSPKNSKSSTTSKPPTVRFNPSFPAPIAHKIHQAAALRSQSVSNFIIEIMTQEAERILEE